MARSFRGADAEEARADERRDDVAVNGITDVPFSQLAALAKGMGVWGRLGGRRSVSVEPLDFVSGPRRHADAASCADFRFNLRGFAKKREKR